MLDETGAVRACGKGAARRRPAVLRPAAACAGALLLLAACSWPAPQIIPAMAPAATPECEVEWPADPTAAPVLACNDGSRQTIQPGPALVVGDPALTQAVP